MSDYDTILGMAPTYDTILDDPTLSIEDQVDAFRELSKTSERVKRRAGRRLFARLQRRGDIPQMRRFLMAFNAYDSDYGFMRVTGDRARHAASFRASMTMRTRRMRTVGRGACPEWMLWNKPEGARFARMMGLHVARQQAPCPAAELTPAPGMAIKPESGSESLGVYLIFSEDRIGDVHNNRFFSGYDTLRDHMAEDLATGRVHKDLWIAEELMADSRDETGVACDWKFYSFYGDIRLIGRMKRFPQMHQAWFDTEGRIVPLGFTLENNETEEAPALPEGLLDLVREISREIPAPFIRIDLLETDKGFALGEFTARPRYWHDFARGLDLEFGDAFIQAQARLEEDLMNGKTFRTWKAFAKDSPYTETPPPPPVKQAATVPENMVTELADADRYDQSARSYREGRLGYSPALIARSAGEARLGPESTVLDLGCGPGTIANEIAAHAGHVLGVDISAAMLEAAREQAPANVTYLQGSSDDLSFIDTPLDLVTFGRSFHWMNRSATLRALDRHVTPGGCLAFFFVGPLPNTAAAPVPEHDWWRMVTRAADRIGGGNKAELQPLEMGGDRDEIVLARSAFSEITTFGTVEPTDWTLERLTAWVMSRYTTDAGRTPEEISAALAKALEPYGPGPWRTWNQHRVLIARRPGA